MSLRQMLIQKGLSHREIEVAELVTTGIMNKQVAEKLFVNEKTIKFHMTNIFKKLGLKSRSQLIVYCLPHMDFVEKLETDFPAQAEPKPTHVIGQEDGKTEPALEIPFGISRVGQA